MYLLKHIYTGVNSVINHLIVALVLTTSACLFSFSAYAGTTAQSPVLSGIAITAYNGHVNTNLFYSDIVKYNASIGFIQPLPLHICNALSVHLTIDSQADTKRVLHLPNLR